jgi:hypothetical protein
MKKWCILMVICLLAITAFGQTEFIIESKDSSSVLTDISMYDEVGLSDSSAKSSAPGCIGVGSKYSSNASISAYFIMKASGHGDFVADTAYNIYVTVPDGYDSINAENSSYTVYDDAHPEGSPLASGTVALTRANCGGSWALVHENVTLGAGAAIKIAEFAPQADRFYSDAVKFMPYSAGPTPTPTPTPTPWPAPQKMGYAPIGFVDDVPSAEFSELFTCDPLVHAPPRYAWFYETGTGFQGDSWNRDSRVFGTNPEDANADAIWTLKSIPAGIYSLGYYVEDSVLTFDNCYYTIECTGTSLDEEVIVSQSETGGTWCLLKENVSLSGDVVITLDNRGRSAETTGNRMFADAVGYFTYPPPTSARSWELYE